MNDIHLPESSLAVWDRPLLPDIGLELENVWADAYPDIWTRVHVGKAHSEQPVRGRGFSSVSALGHSAHQWICDVVGLSATQGQSGVAARPGWAVNADAVSVRGA